MKPEEILQSDPSAGFVHRVEVQGVFRFHERQGSGDLK